MRFLPPLLLHGAHRTATTRSRPMRRCFTTLAPLLAVGQAAASNPGTGWLATAKALDVIAAIILAGRLLLRPALR